MERNPDDDHDENKENWAFSFTQDDCIEWRGGEDGVDLRTLMTPKISSTQLTQQQSIRSTPASLKQLKRKLHKAPTRKSPRRAAIEKENVNDACIEQQVDELFDFLDTKDGNSSTTFSNVPLLDRPALSKRSDKRQRRSTTQVGRRNVKRPPSPDGSKRRRTSAGRNRRRPRSLPEPGKEPSAIQEDTLFTTSESGEMDQNEKAFETLLSQLDTNPRGKIKDPCSSQPSESSSMMPNECRKPHASVTQSTAPSKTLMAPPQNKYLHNAKKIVPKQSSLHQKATSGRVAQSKSLVPKQKYIVDDNIAAQKAGNKYDSLDSKHSTGTNISARQTVQPPVQGPLHTTSQQKTGIERTNQVATQKPKIIQNQALVNKYNKNQNANEIGSSLNRYPLVKNQGQPVKRQPMIQSKPTAAASREPIQNQSTRPALPKQYENQSNTSISTTQNQSTRPTFPKQHENQSNTSTSSKTVQKTHSPQMKPPIEQRVKPKKTKDIEDEFDSLLDFSAEDIACMDALVTAATQRESLSQRSIPDQSAGNSIRETQKHVSSRPTSTKSDSSKERETNRKPLADASNKQKCSPKGVFEEHLFDDLPMIDFDALDKQIANRNTSVANTKPSICTVEHNTNPTDMIRKKFVMTPPVRNRRVESIDRSNVAFISFTRYKVVQVTNDPSTYTKTLVVAAWNNSMRGDNNINIHRLEKLKLDSPQKDSAENDADGCIFLRGEWYHEKVAKGDIIHLCSLTGRFMTGVDALPVLLHSAPSQSSDGDDLALIVHPDMLVTPTLISEAVTCSRRAVLKERLGSAGLSSKAALFGTMRHGLFERCMTSHDFSLESATKFTRSVVREFSDSLVGCGVTDKEAQTEVLRVLPQLKRFSYEFTAFDTKSNGNRSKLQGLGAHAGIDFMARSVQGTEESAISPELGLKGNIDVTVEAETMDLHTERVSQPRHSGNSVRKSLMCIELKTGHNQNPQNAHMGQLALYTMMLQVQEGSKIVNQTNSNTTQTQSIEHVTGADGGMLLYLNQKGYNAVHVEPGLSDIKSLIGQRNVVANETRKASKPRGITLLYEDENKTRNSEDYRARLEVHPAPPAALPDLITSSHSCERCYSNRECMMYAGAELHIAPQSPALPGSISKTHGPLLQHFTGHLNEGDMAYFREWDRLIDLEADACNFNTPEAWLEGSIDREKTSGKCMSSLIFDDIGSTSINIAQTSGLDEASSAEMLDSVVLLKFHRANDSELQTPLSSLKIEPGSHVVLSTDTTSFELTLQFENTSIAENPTKAAKRFFRHRMHVVRGLMKSATENTVIIQSSWRDLQQVKKLVQKYKAGSREKNSTLAVSQELHFRLDKDEVSTGTGTLRQNLINLFTCDSEPFLSEKKSMLHVQSQSQMKDSPGSANTIPLRRRMSFLRDVIIRLRQPVFDTKSVKSMFNFLPVDPTERPASIPGCDFMDLAAEYAELNPDQRNAVEKVISAKDYSLIQGLPGTGKTSTIAFIVRLLAARGKRVLVSSYTHAAVDNVMMKLMDKGLASTSKNGLSALVRVGKRSSCHPDVQSILVDSIAVDREKSASQLERTNDSLEGSQEKPTAENLSYVVSSARIVGVTTLSVPRSPLLIGQHFDVVIIDEAGQISQPAILGALMAADSFVLVGDHMQLPPLVTSAAADEGGYGISMLKRLADKFPRSVAQLALQYRMHGDICQLCNDIVYKGSLKCANADVRSRQLKLVGFPSALVTCSIGQRSQLVMGWLPKVVDPSRPVVFADTDDIRPKTGSSNVIAKATSVSGKESSLFQGLERSLGNRNNGNIVNDTEIALVRCIVHGLLECGLQASSIGVISPFRAQLRMFDECQYFQRWKKSGLEFSTIDRYQGRDKEVIILSFVRSNSNGRSGRLLDDFRRLNVAVSRAKRKLIMVGSMKTLYTGSPALRPALDGIKTRNFVEKLRGDSLDMYDIF